MDFTTQRIADTSGCLTINDSITEMSRMNLCSKMLLRERVVERGTMAKIRCGSKVVRLYESKPVWINLTRNILEHDRSYYTLTYRGTTYIRTSQKSHVNSDGINTLQDVA